MCGRFAVLVYDEVCGVVRSIQFDTPFLMEPDWPGARPQARPGSKAFVLSRGEESLEVDELTWGFSKGSKRNLVFNTRIETALGAQPGMWRGPMEQGRCIVPAAGFFEPHGTEALVNPVTGRKAKRQYCFEGEDGAPLLLAAVKEGEAFSIVTTQPNKVVAPIHDRMPLVLERSDVRQWLEGDLSAVSALADRSQVACKVRACDPQGYEVMPEQQTLFTE